MTLVLLLIGAGVRVLGDTAAHACKTATDTFIGLVEQARSSAITSRSFVVLALAEPGDLPSGDERCFIGLFKIAEWPAEPGTLEGTLLRRWQSLPRGAVILPGAVNGLRNPRDEAETTIRYLAGNQSLQGRFHIIAFSPRGALHWPAGSDPLALRVAAGAYRNGQPSPNTRDSHGGGAENRFKIGRVTARPYRFDG